MFFFLVIHRTLHFAGWNSICHSSSHFSSLFKSYCNFPQSSIAETVRYTIVSSANRRIWECFVYCGISSMKIRNRIGPRTDPWGTPLVTGTDLDSSPSIMTFCDRPDRKDFIQLLACLSIPHGPASKSADRVRLYQRLC